MTHNNAFSATGGPPPFFNDGVDWPTNPSDYFQQPLHLPGASWSIEADELSHPVLGDMTSYPIQRLDHHSHLGRAPIDRFMGESERPLFQIAPLQSPRQDQSVFGPVNTVPQPNSGVGREIYRRYSPSPSNGMASSGDSAMSPDGATYYEYSYSPQSQALDSGSPDTVYDHGMFQDLDGGYQAGFDGVSLNQIQEFEDIPGDELEYEIGVGIVQKSQGQLGSEGMFPYTDQDEGMIAKGGLQSGYGRAMDFSGFRDEGLGKSVHDEASPQPGSTHLQQGDGDASKRDVDADAYGEDEDEADEAEIEVDSQLIEDGEAEESSDEEYTPRNTRSRKRTGTRQHASTTTKRYRPSLSTGNSKSKSKSSPRPKPKAQTTPPTNGAGNEPKRRFTCSFSFAGCPSTFTSKNEWKRHTSSQHLNLQVYICRSGGCAKSPTLPEFNRKDLFTQHLRRMHAPSQLAKKASAHGKKGASAAADGLESLREEWEEKVKSLQESGLVQKRKAPTGLVCCAEDCREVFQGSDAWDARMEHVGRHLEKGDVVKDESDRGLVGWARETGIVEKVEGGGWRLVEDKGGRGGKGGAGGQRGIIGARDVDADADGEEE